jgi:hypothetical protein
MTGGVFLNTPAWTQRQHPKPGGPGSCIATRRTSADRGSYGGPDASGCREISAELAAAIASDPSSGRRRVRCAWPTPEWKRVAASGIPGQKSPRSSPPSTASVTPVM